MLWSRTWSINNCFLLSIEQFLKKEFNVKNKLDVMQLKWIINGMPQYFLRRLKETLFAG